MCGSTIDSLIGYKVIAQSFFALYLPSQKPLYIIIREVAQPGSALGWGSRGRKFESCLPDKKAQQNAELFYFQILNLIRSFFSFSRVCQSIKRNSSTSINPSSDPEILFHDIMPAAILSAFFAR